MTTKSYIQARNEAQARVAAKMAQPLQHFSRNGRWGTCAACPRTGDGSVYPEQCKNTERDDHQLDITSLKFQFENNLREDNWSMRYHAECARDEQTLRDALDENRRDNEHLLRIPRVR